MEDAPSPDLFDAAFRDAARSEWVRRVLAADLPPGVDPLSFITADGLDEIARLLADCRERTILDLACGAGGPGQWLVDQIGAELIGVDFSPVAIEQARARAGDAGRELKVRYVLGDATAIDLPSASIDGVVCIDAIQLMADKPAVLSEVHRLVRPGRRVVFTTWEQADAAGEMADLFTTAGFAGIDVQERPAWLARERALFERAIADAPRLPDDACLQGIAEEGEVVLAQRARRVLVVATKPAGSQG